MDEAPSGEGGMFSTVTRLLQRLRDTAELRLELFLLELKEERVRLVDALLLTGIAIVFALMTLVMLTLTVVVIFWDSHRLLVLTVITVLYAVAAAVAIMKLRSRLQRWESFSATMEEFKKDSACFKQPN
jgi:uncharacterized membrane protein YqjE